MRTLLGLVLLTATAAPTAAHAADGTLATGGAHEVVWTPATTLPVRGPRFAPVTIDVYVALGHLPSYASAELARRAVARSGDVREVVHPFGFGTAAELAAGLKRLGVAYPGLVRVAWKNFPSPYRASIGEVAAEYAAAAAAQGRFWDVYDAAMATRLQPLKTTPAELERMGTTAGVDGARLHAEVASGRAKAAVERDAEEARRLSVPTAGSVVVNGIPVAGAPSYELLDRLVAAELDVGVLERLRRR